jgi:hypothetical protein
MKKLNSSVQCDWLRFPYFNYSCLICFGFQGPSSEGHLYTNTVRSHHKATKATKSHKVYIGQTGRNLTTRYKELIRKVRLNKDKSAFAQHILNKQHQYGPMTIIIELIEKAKKGGIMIIKDYHIYHFNKFNKLIEEQKHTKESKNQRNIFNLIIQHQNTPTLTSQTQEE